MDTDDIRPSTEKMKVSMCSALFQLGPNVSIGTGVTIGAGVRVRESIILHGATLQVRPDRSRQTGSPLSESDQSFAARDVKDSLVVLSRASSDLNGCYL